MRRLAFAFIVSLFAKASAAQAGQTPPVPIQDNSFLIEEAYNQERGVVQHINTFERHRGGEWAYTFTQEWPAPTQRHQLGYTIPLSSGTDLNGGRSGIGDVAINYRYQAGRIEGATTAFAPRLSLLLPTGASRNSLGAGGFGAQVNLPFSAELPHSLVAHSNAGVTYVPNARNALDEKARTTGYNLGQSLIWLAHPKINLMLEVAWTSDQEVTGSGKTLRSTGAVISPGVRGAIDFASGLQVVPGIAVPIGIGPSRGERTVFFYLSFEHPFSRQEP